MIVTRSDKKISAGGRATAIPVSLLSRLKRELFASTTSGLLCATCGDSQRPRGVMDKASDFEAEDCGFDSRRGLEIFCSQNYFIVPISVDRH